MKLVCVAALITFSAGCETMPYFASYAPNVASGQLEYHRVDKVNRLVYQVEAMRSVGSEVPTQIVWVNLTNFSQGTVCLQPQSVSLHAEGKQLVLKEIRDAIREENGIRIIGVMKDSCLDSNASRLIEFVFEASPDASQPRTMEFHLGTLAVAGEVVTVSPFEFLQR